jgi:hypothetical protein
VTYWKCLCVLPQWTVSTALIGATISTFAFGQTETQAPVSTSEPPVPAAAEVTSLHEVVVTAQKREQRLQDVPKFLCDGHNGRRLVAS